MVKNKHMEQESEREERLTLATKRNMQFEKFRRNLRVLRAGKDISAVDLGKELGWEKQGKRILDMEYGRATPKLDELIALTKYFEVTLDELLFKDAIIAFK